MYISNGSSSSTIGTTWTTIGTFSSTVSSTNWSYAGNTLTAANTDAVEGLYLIKYSLSFGADAADWSVGISIAGADPTEPIFNRTIGTGRDGDKGNVSGSILVQISKTNTIELQVKANAAAQSFTPVHAQVVVARVAETSVNYYGGMHISSDQTYANLSDPAGTFVKLTGYAAFDEMSDWTVSNSELTAGTSAAGTYLVVLSASFTGDKSGATPVDCSFDIVKDGTTSINALAVRKTGDSDIGNISAAGIVSISSGSTISIEGAQSTKKLDLIMKKSTVSLYKIVDSTSVSYAGSKITSDQTVTITTQSEWTTVGTFTNDTAYGWSFASNVYTPSLQATSGFYFLDYAASLTTANTSGDDIELGIFIGSYIHPEFTTLRRLADETDIGAVSGNAIFKVDHIDSTITMKVRNTTSTNNLTFKKTYLSNAQIRYVYTENALPITLSNFTAEQNGSGVKLDWQTASEIDNARFLIYRDDEVIASIKGAGTTTEPHYYSFTDNYVVPGKTYTYVLADVSYSNVEVKHKNKAISLTIHEGNVSKDYQIGKAYPNPFNPSTVIPVNLAREAQVNAEMYDIAGHKIKSLFDGTMNAGSHKLHVNGGDLSTGVYLVHIKIEGISTIRKISLMK